MARKAKIDYDKKNDLLYIYTGEAAKDSIELDNFVYDISHSGNIIGIEIFNASKFLSKLIKYKFVKK